MPGVAINIIGNNLTNLNTKNVNGDIALIVGN